MAEFEKLSFFAFDLEKVNFAVLDVTASEESADDVAKAFKQALSARYSEQPWLNENDPNKNFEEAELELKNLVDLLEQFEQKFEPALNNALGYFIAGRSFSGRRIGRHAGFYAYLAKSEVEEVITLLERHFDEGVDLLDKGAFCKVDFDSKMLDIMEALLLVLRQGRKHDLFVYNSENVT